MEVDVQTAKIVVFVIVRYRPKGRSPYPAVQTLSRWCVGRGLISHLPSSNPPY